MGGELKNRVRMGITLDKELYERLKAYSDQSMIPMSRLVERTIKDYLECDIHWPFKQIPKNKMRK